MTSEYALMNPAELKIEDLILLRRFYHLSSDYLIGLSDVTAPCPTHK